MKIFYRFLYVLLSFPAFILEVAVDAFIMFVVMPLYLIARNIIYIIKGDKDFIKLDLILNLSNFITEFMDKLEDKGNGL